MPVKKVKKTRGQTIVQNVKVVVGAAAKRPKRKYTRKPKVGMKGVGQAPMTGPSTIYGEPIPLPPRTIEVPVAYRLTEGATTASGVTPPLLTAPQEKPAMTGPISKPVLPSLPAPEATKLIEGPQITAEEEDFFLSLKPKSTFYKSYEKKQTPTKVQEYTFSAVNPLARKPKQEAEPMFPVSEQIEELPRSVSRPTPKKKSEIINIELGAPSEPSIFQKEKVMDFPQEAREPEFPSAAVAAAEIPSEKKRSTWNITQNMIAFYSAQTGKTVEQSKRALNKIRKEHPSARPSDVISAIESGDFKGNTLG
jgi:hypothetical protein